MKSKRKKEQEKKNLERERNAERNRNAYFQRFQAERKTKFVCFFNRMRDFCRNRFSAVLWLFHDSKLTEK